MPSRLNPLSMRFMRCLWAHPIGGYISVKLRTLSLHAFTGDRGFKRKSHGFGTILGVRPGVSRSGGRRRTWWRPPCRRDPQVKSVVRVVDKRACRRDDNILRFCPRLIHGRLVESGHKKVRDTTLINLDIIREHHMVHNVALLGGI